MNKHQKAVDEWFQEQNWEYWDPLVITTRLFEEVGEFARLINHEYGAKQKRADEGAQKLEEEIEDIMYTLICFANSHDIDLDDAIQKSIDKVADRDKDRY